MARTHRRQPPWLAAAGPQDAGTRLLDVGCGSGLLPGLVVIGPAENYFLSGLFSRVLPA